VFVVPPSGGVSGSLSDRFFRNMLRTESIYIYAVCNISQNASNVNKKITFVFAFAIIRLDNRRAV